MELCSSTAVQSLRQVSLVQCGLQHPTFCCRTFLPDKLAKHQLGCTAARPMEKAGACAAPRLHPRVVRPPPALRPALKLPAIGRDGLDRDQQPGLQDFTELLEGSGVLEDKELSQQLLFLINFFINKKQKN